MESMSKPGIDMKYKLIYCPNYITVKGNYTVLSYEENLIIIKCYKDNIFISGENVVISMLGNDELYISGKISDIMFN